MDKVKERSILALGAAMYLKETPLILELINQALDINNNDFNEAKLDEIESYISSQLIKKITPEEISQITLNTDMN